MIRWTGLTPCKFEFPFRTYVLARGGPDPIRSSSMFSPEAGPSRYGPHSFVGSQDCLEKELIARDKYKSSLAKVSSTRPSYITLVHHSTSTRRLSTTRPSYITPLHHSTSPPSPHITPLHHCTSTLGVKSNLVITR